MVNEGNRVVNKPFDPTKPVRTLDGRPARIICTDRKWKPAEYSFPIVALVGLEGHECLYVYTKDGEGDPGCAHDTDLVNIPEKVTVYVYRNKWSGNVWVTGNYCHPTVLNDSEFVKQVEIEV